MNIKTENKNCQNCKKDFTIESDDFNFYEKIKVPPPTWCPECRFIRRVAWRNERNLYKRACDLCSKKIISVYHENVPFPVYCLDCWYGDGWDPTLYGREYDFSKTFFEQYKELANTVPHMAVWSRNMVNSDFTNLCGESKNVYLSVSVLKDSENVFHSKSVDHSRDIVDSLNVVGSEGLFENIEAQNNYNSQYLLMCRSCIDCYYSVDCVNCSNCFLSYNLRNKQYCILNQQYTREEYFKELGKFNLKSRTVRADLLKEFHELIKKAIFKFGNINKSVDVTGNNILNVKNGKQCFDVYNLENAKYCYRAFDDKDCMDCCYFGWSELFYEYSTAARNGYNVKFSYSAIDSVRNADYTESCRNCNNLFGCVSLHNKNNAILNKVYSEEEYQKLRIKIINHMNEMPFVDKQGIYYRYGEFFPTALSHIAYNESQAMDFMPLSKEEVESYGYKWFEKKDKNFVVTMPVENIPDDIESVGEEILNEVLGCSHKGECEHQCNLVYRITNYELSFYKKHNIPIPDTCPNCRYYLRFAVMPEIKLYHRTCMKHGCTNEFETAYSPERPEIIYCERCYQQEVY